MTSRERMKRALEHEEIDRFPRNIWCLPNVFMFCMEDYKKFEKDYESDIIGPNIIYG